MTDRENVEALISETKAFNEAEKPWTALKKISVFGPFVSLFVAIIVTAIFPALILFSTLCVFLCSLNLLWAAVWFIKKVDLAVDDDQWGEIFLFCLLIVGGCYGMYSSHDIAQWLATNTREIAIATPHVLMHALKEAFMGIWNFVANFFSHAFYGSPA